MTPRAAARIAAGGHGLTRRTLLGVLPLLLIRVGQLSAQHAGHDMAHGARKAAIDSTPKIRAIAAEQRAWLGVRLALIGIGVGAYFAWWRYQVVKARRAKLAKKEGRTGNSPGEQPRPLPRQRRRR